jgi:perosamine synthetase
MDPVQIEEAVTEKTRAILCVHQIGMPCDLREILKVAGAKGLKVIEDAACAAGSEIRLGGEWEKIGKPHGDIACFSFHPRKVITTGEGGMLTTNDSEFDQMFRRLRQHGMSVPDTERHGSREVIFESYPVVGYNYRMTDIQAAVGREQLKRLPELVARRRSLAAAYHKKLSEIAGAGLPHEPEWAKSNWQSYCVRLPEGCNQREVMQFMLDRGVATRRGIMCSHKEGSCSDIPVRHGLDESERAQEEGNLIPFYVQMTEEDQIRVADTLRQGCEAI